MMASMDADDEAQDEGDQGTQSLTQEEGILIRILLGLR